MKWKNVTIFFTLFFLFQVNNLYSQGGEKYRSVLSIVHENDFINYRGSGTDRYFTCGIQLRYSYPTGKLNDFFRHLLITAGDNDLSFSYWELSQLMFTPSNISKPIPQPGDRPYAGALYLSKGLTTFNKASGLIIQSEMNLGMIGPYSYTKEVQTFVHKQINDEKPMGWNTQIKNDLIINYNITIKKMLVLMNQLQANVKIISRVGTLYNDLGAGFEINAGKINSILPVYSSNFLASRQASGNKHQLYFFADGQVRFVLGNSLLQGGVVHAFKNDCADFYHISEDNLTRCVTNAEMGVAYSGRRWKFTFSQNYCSSEFKNGCSQLFGKIGISYAL